MYYVCPVWAEQAGGRGRALSTLLDQFDNYLYSQLLCICISKSYVFVCPVWAEQAGGRGGARGGRKSKPPALPTELDTDHWHNSFSFFLEPLSQFFWQGKLIKYREKNCAATIA